MKTILVYGMTNNRGGIESYIMNIYRHMDKSRLQFDFVTDFPEMAYADEVQSGGSRIHYIPGKRKAPLKHLLAFRRILREHPEYDTVYFNILNAGAAYTMRVAKQMGRRIITHSHNGSDCNMRLHRFFQKSLLRCTDVKLACSAVAGKYMYGDLQDVHIIPNAIDLNAYVFSKDVRENKRRELSLAEDAFAVLHVGRLAEQKNPLFLLEIFSEIAKRNSRAVMLYVGAGEMKEEILACVRNLRMEDKVRFLGMRKDVEELYQAADVFLLPSLFEGFPIVGIEAQASGLPCFFSDRITRELALTELARFYPLELGASGWAEEILKLALPERTGWETVLADKGYSIGVSAAQTAKILMG